MLMPHTHTYQNLCPRCGQPRIETTTIAETDENGKKTRKISSVCPDIDCQNEVLKSLNNINKDRQRKELARAARLAKIKEKFLNN